MTNTALLEIGIEELPASEMSQIQQQLQLLTEKLFTEKRLAFRTVLSMVTNRRMAVLVKEIAERQEDSILEKRGPSKSTAFLDGKPTKALIGFLSANEASEEDIYLKDEYVYIRKKVPGRKASEVLPEIFTEVIQSLKFTKSMRWGNGKYLFVRPVKWVVLMLNNQILPFQIFGKNSSNKTQGHPDLQKVITVENCADYIDLLKNHYVLVNQEERIEKIKAELAKIEKEHFLTCDRDKELIKKISNLLEWPTAIVGKFKEEYLNLPEELITVTVKHHLSAFTTFENQKITPYFVAFIDNPFGNIEKITIGYSNVVNARLEDARYYFEIDKRYNLEDFNERLKGMVFQKELGTLFDKVLRIKKLSLYMAEKLGLSQMAEKIGRAAILSKADIASHVVYEFPELQGTIGKLYALMNEEDAEVAEAIEEQYFDEPKTITGSIIAIADRIDTIIGNLAVGNIPSGSRDPFGLRNKSDVIFKTIVNRKWDLDLEELIRETLKLLSITCKWEIISDFMSNRYYAFLSGEGFNYDLSRAVNHLWSKPLRGFLSARALAEMVKNNSFNELCVGFERVHNITKNFNDTKFDGALFEENAEIELLNRFIEVKSTVISSLKELDYERGVSSLITLKPFIDKYFDDVFVMVNREDIRKNRLAFLKNIDELFMMIGDLTQLIKRE